MRTQVPIGNESCLGAGRGECRAVASDLAYQTLALVNIIFYGPERAGSGKWVLIDAGHPGSAARIVRTAQRRFGRNSRPAAIILTHGHRDHAGAAPRLAHFWKVPVFAHDLEAPHLNGGRSYPAPDPRAGGGLLSRLARFAPRGPIDLGEWLRALPADGLISCMPGWRWIHTPGHTRGHIALWREADETLIAGDAFLSTNRESAYALARQLPEVHGPPMYSTPDWGAARESVRRLATLQPERVITGHGRALHGSEMLLALQRLARDFDRIAIPEHHQTSPVLPN